MERGPLVLRGEGVALGVQKGVVWRVEGRYEESVWDSHGLGMDDLQNCQDTGAAHANRLRGLAITRRPKVVNLK